TVLQLFDRATGRRTARIETPWVQRLRFFADGQRIAGGAQDGTVFVVDTPAGGPPGASRDLGKVAGPVDVETLDVARDGRTIVAGGARGNVVAFDVLGDPPRELTRFHGGIVTSLVVSGGAVVVAAQVEHTIVIRRIALAAPFTVETLATLATDPDPDP